MAHDLNNAFTPLLMVTDMLRPHVHDAAGLGLLALLEDSVQRGAAVVRQVMAFSRGLQGQRTRVHVGHIAQVLERRLQDLHGQAPGFTLLLQDDLWAVRADPALLHELLWHLCSRALDAQPVGGHVTVTIRNVTHDAPLAGVTGEIPAGDYVVIALRDSGLPVSGRVLARIAAGEPHGAEDQWLARVLAITSSHDGFLRVEGEEAGKRTLKILLPIAEPRDLASWHDPEPGADLEGRGELVLVVDDEDAVRLTIAHTLERHGYLTMQAADGGRAVTLYGEHRHDVALVIVDLAMPDLGGWATIAALRKLEPEVRLVASTGDAAGGHRATGAHLGVRHVIKKPYTVEALLRTVRQALDAPSPSAD
ncbi:response regulator [Luteitalea sp. TBR-22]|uniref:response regulator n=1 Tax=Luteitalea sp. TBR-22 TaxID=2802971 RepID=UPI001EF5F268|nr:response regulator [Luteitalea sp. TBR-22]